MSSAIFTDLANIKRVSYDENGVRSETTNTNIPCRVEDEVRVVRNTQGQEIASRFSVLLDYSTMLDYNDIIMFTKVSGKEWTEPDKEWQVLSLSNVRLMAGHHIEVLV